MGRDQRVKLIFFGVFALAALGLSALADSLTYDPRSWQAEHDEVKEAVRPAALAAVGAGRVTKTEVMALDRETKAAIANARSRVRAYFALRRFRRVFEDRRFDLGPYDAQAWLVELDGVQAKLAQGYANLDWQVERRGLDLRKLDREARAGLLRARSTGEALSALEHLIRAFRDPHLRMRPAESGPTNVARGDAADAGPAPAATNEDCARGYNEADHRFQFPFDGLPGWRVLREGEIPVGIAGDLGVVRIAQFGEDSYLSICRQVVASGVVRQQLKRAVRSALQAKLTEALRDLAAAGARRLLLDLTGNGGGTEWSLAAIALLTDRRLSRAARREAAPTCDRRGLWRGERAPCPVLGPVGRNELRNELQGKGVWTGPLVVLADRHTGSAAEEAVAWLRANQVPVIGERTGGAGCGYLNGPTRFTFRQVPLEVVMPNCARFLEDGTNEIEGIAPDVIIPMNGSNPTALAEALKAALVKIEAEPM